VGRASGTIDARMVGNLAKRAVNLAVLLLAAVTFFLVPFGRRTLYRHLVAVFTTDEAKEMKREVEAKGHEIVDEVKSSTPLASPLASPDGGK
jgi:hypothetical protein